MKKACCLSLLLVWTLWTRTQTPTSDTWAPAPGLASQEKCQASMKDKMDLWRQFKDSKFDGNSVTFSNNSTMTYLCLPESEDPRKPAKPAKPAKPQK